MKTKNFSNERKAKYFLSMGKRHEEEANLAYKYFTVCKRDGDLASVVRDFYRLFTEHLDAAHRYFQKYLGVC